jgi:hypothetical protein
MAMPVDTDAHDEGLQQCLSKCHDLIIRPCIDKLGIEGQQKRKSPSGSERDEQPPRQNKRQRQQERNIQEQSKKVSTVTCLPGGQALCKKRNDDRGCTKREQDCPDKRAHKCDALVNGKACGKVECFRWKH